MIRVAVCSDDSMVLEQVQKAADRILGAGSCDRYGEICSLLMALDDGWTYRAVFLDIRWDKKAKGIDAAEKIFRVEPETKIIYMTAYPRQYIQQIFFTSANVNGFLIKPIDDALLEKNLWKLRDAEQKEAPNSLMIRYKSTIYSIRFDEILYLESVGHVVIIHTRTEEHNCYSRLDKLYERLPEYFIQCHKSYVVNMNEIRRMDKSQVLMGDETKIPISKTRYQATKNRYGCYAEQIRMTSR